MRNASHRTWPPRRSNEQGPQALRKRETTPNVSETSSAPAVHQTDLRAADPTRAVGHVAAKAAARNDEAAAGRHWGLRLRPSCGYWRGDGYEEKVGSEECGQRRCRSGCGGGGELARGRKQTGAATGRVELASARAEGSESEDRRREGAEVYALFFSFLIEKRKTDQAPRRWKDDLGARRMPAHHLRQNRHPCLKKKLWFPK